MWARKRLDLAWSDLAAAALSCAVPGGRARWQRIIERTWPAGSHTLACLSVRSGFDLLLRSLNLPPRSEILVSALTIRDMVRIIEEHGHVAVPVDLDVARMAPNLDSLRRAVTPASKAILVAHLFGGRIDLDPIVGFARRHNLLMVEDCAQAYAGREYSGHPDVDAAMFSFGPIKTATALQGALFKVRDPRVLARMRELLAAQPTQSRWTFFKRILKYSALKAFSARRTFLGLVKYCALRGWDYDQMVNGAVRGFPGDGFFGRIRQQPSRPMLCLLARRLNNFRSESIAARARLGQGLLEALSPGVVCPGWESQPHHFWVFPILVDNPAATIAAVRAAGFDATQGQSLCVVEPPPGREHLDPQRTRRAIAKIVYLPCYLEMPEADLRRLANVVNETAVPVRDLDTEPEHDEPESALALVAPPTGARRLTPELR